jgi:hypothetical protein
MTPDLIQALVWTLVRTGLILIIAGLVAWGVLRITPCRSVRLHRIL